MNADQAFDNLMNKNALPIPVADGIDGDAAHTARGVDDTTRFRERERQDGATMRVDQLLDQEPGDYHPMGGNPIESERTVYSHPTETELAAVGLEDPVSEAHMHGARVVGRDTRSYDDSPAGLAEPEEFVDVSDVDGEPGEFGLNRTRRVHRFAYLPLFGMDRFDSGARELAVRLGSQVPDRPSLAVTSAVRGEGRTEMAIRLALAMAKRVDHRILLADFDVRRPSVASRLGVSTKYFTMADVLRGSCLLGEALVASEEDNLYVLPARPFDRDGDEVLDARQVEAALADIHAAFDFAILDCGPASRADTAMVCRLAGSVALVGYCGRSSAGLMRTTADTLASSGAKVAGMLISGA